MTVATETQRTIDLFERADQLEEVAESLPVDDPRRSVLIRIMEQTLADVAPVRPVVAADILHMTEKTVRSWAKEGVLDVWSSEPRLLLDPGKLHAVTRLVSDLRKAGRTRGLLDEVYRRLADASLLDRADLLESLEQMARGEMIILRPGRVEP